METNGTAPTAAQMDETAQAAATSPAAAAASGPPSDRLILTNGVELRLRPVPPLFIEAAQNQIAVPEVPTFWHEGREREEPNPGHPDYIAAVARYDMLQNMAAVNALLVMGVDVASVPDGVDGIASDGWIEMCELLNIPVKRDSVPGRKLAYLRNYALQNLEDIDALLTAVGRLTGVSEEDVAKAVDTFRGGEGRGGDSDSAPVAGAGHGDHVPALSAGPGV